MNEQTARNKGLQYTGIYERNTESLKPRLEEIRKAGYKAYIVTVPDSPYSRSSCIGTGYSVYTEPRYQADNAAKTSQQRILFHASRLTSIRARFESEMAKEMEEENKANDRDVKWLTENNYPLAGS
jgi:hypothetical protein